MAHSLGLNVVAEGVDVAHRLFLELVESLGASPSDVSGLGVGIPGPIDRVTGRVGIANHDVRDGRAHLSQRHAWFDTERARRPRCSGHFDPRTDLVQRDQHNSIA